MANSFPSRDELIVLTFKALLELGGSGTNDEIVQKVAEISNLPNELIDEPQKGHPGMTKFEYELAWARTYLKKSGVINRVGYRLWSLTADFMEYRELNLDTIKKNAKNINDDNNEENDIVDNVFDDNDWRVAVSEKIKNMDPNGFERLSKLLLRKCGFDDLIVTKKSGDGGIDGYGILRINPVIGLKVAFQCKRYGDTKVSVDEIREFRGALSTDIELGIFITTGTYTKTAIDEAKAKGSKNINLIDGNEFISKLAEYEIGLKKKTTYEIDSEYFENI